MKLKVALVTALLTALAFYGTGIAQGLIVYPAQNQSQEQMDRDMAECQAWARNQTGFDPNAGPPGTFDARTRNSAGRAAIGGAQGGALGAGVGAIAGGGSGAGTGAAIGALTGGTFGGLRSRSQNRRARRAQQDFAASQRAQFNAQRNNFDRAYSACLVGRGYTVN
jgi:hypothetical protein